MRKSAGSFDARQEMAAGGFEIQHKKDTGLQNVALHHHDFYEIYYLVSGEVTYLIEGRKCPVSPGDLLLVSPRELHLLSIAGPKDYERYVLWIRADEVRRLSAPDCDLEQGLRSDRQGCSNLLRPDPEQRETVLRCMETLWQEAASGEYGARLLSESCLRQLLILIGREQERGAESRPTVQEGLTTKVLRYVSEHCREEFSLDSLAQQLFVSKYYLCHEFQRQTGTSIYRYLKKKRLQLARELLRGGVSPGAAGAEIGYRDYSCFYRAFLGEYGETPGACAAGFQTK